MLSNFPHSDTFIIPKTTESSRLLSFLAYISVTYFLLPITAYPSLEALLPPPLSSVHTVRHQTIRELCSLLIPIFVTFYFEAPEYRDKWMIVVWSGVMQCDTTNWSDGW